jgi:glycosyltransferase involved in cell wall biosynthesis
MARPVVASPEALAGLGELPDLPAVRAQNLAEWVEALGDLLDNRPRRRQLGLAGRQYVERHHEWDRCLEAFLPLLSLQGDGDTVTLGRRGPARLATG